MPRNGVGSSHTIYVFFCGFILGLVFFLGLGIYLLPMSGNVGLLVSEGSHFSQLSTLLALGHRKSALFCFVKFLVFLLRNISHILLMMQTFP